MKREGRRVARYYDARPRYARARRTSAICGIALAALATWQRPAAAQQPSRLAVGPWSIGSSVLDSGVDSAQCRPQAGLRLPATLPPLVVGTTSLEQGIARRSLARRTVICTAGAATLHFVRDTLYAVTATLTGADGAGSAAVAHWRDSLARVYGAATPVWSAGWSVAIERQVVRCPGAVNEMFLFTVGAGRAVALATGCRPGSATPVGLVVAVDSSFARGLRLAPGGAAQMPGYDDPFVGSGDVVIGGTLDSSQRSSCESLAPRYGRSASPVQLPFALLPAAEPRVSSLGEINWSADVRRIATATTRCSVAFGVYAFLAADTVYALRANYDVPHGDVGVDALRDTLALLFGPADSTVMVAGRWYLPAAVEGCRTSRLHTATYHHGPAGRQVQSLVLCRMAREFPAGSAPVEMPRVYAAVFWIDLDRVRRIAAPSPARRAVRRPSRTTN